MVRHSEVNNHPASGLVEISAKHMHLELFGAFRLHRDNQPVAGFEHARLQHLLAYLSLNRAAPIMRQQLAFIFWPDSTDQQALKNLRTSLSRLRRALPEAEHILKITGQTIQWRTDAPITLDVAEFDTMMTAAETAKAAGDSSQMMKVFQAAAGVYQGDLLPSCYDDWILPVRDRYRQTYRAALEQLALLLEEHRQYNRALPYAKRLLNHDPLSEAAYHLLIRLHLGLGEQTEALRLCRMCDTMLKREYGLARTPATQDLYGQLLETKSQPAPAFMKQLPGIPGASLPLVGRNNEWSRLITAWQSAYSGHPHLVLISGEAGIGKTRLAEELCAWVARQGTVVAVAHCYPSSGGSVAYAPVIEWLRERRLQERLAALEDVWLVEVARILPELLVNRRHLKSPGAFTEAWQRTRMFGALTRAVLGSEKHAPLLLFLDDLQWCDQETMDWLGYLLRFAAGAPLLVIATVRKYEIDRVHPLMSFWLALNRSGLLSEIPLEPLDAADTEQLAANIAGKALRNEETIQIYHDSEGNPLFVVEMVRARMQDQHYSTLETSWNIPSTPATLPPKVRAVIQWRLAQLSPTAQSLVKTAAVIGRKFSFEVLVKASHQGDADVMKGLDELWQRHIVRPQGEIAYDFSHDGMRSVTYDEIAPHQRRATHLRVAQALEELNQDNLDAFNIQIASHYERAGKIEPAIEYYRRAASVAKGVYANATAAQLYQHLLESDLSVGLSKADKCIVMLALAEAWRANGQWARAETINRNALTEAEVLGDTHLIARSKCDLANVLHLLGYYDAALQHLAEAEQSFQLAGDLVNLAGALFIAGNIHWLRGDYNQALTILEQELEIASTINEPRSICEALQAIGLVQWSQGDLPRAAEHCLKSILIASQHEYKPPLARASITLGNIRSAEGWFGEAIYWFQRAGALAREIDDRQALTRVISRVALILAKRGDYDHARAGYERSLHYAWEIGDRWTACLNIAGLAMIYEQLAKVQEAETLYRQAIHFGLNLSIPGYLPDMLVGLGRCLLAQGRLEEARRVHAEALDQIANGTYERIADGDIRFEAQVLGIRLRHALNESTEALAIELRALLLQEVTPLHQATLHYEAWQLGLGDETDRQTAATLYRTEYAETGAEECRRHYRELTQEMLSDPPPLPDVSELIPVQPETVNLAALLAKLEASFE